MLTPPQQLKQSLSGTSSVLVTHLYGLGREAIGMADIEEWPLAQIVETLDERTCPLCRSLHGMILSKTDPRYHQYKYPSHIGCRRIMVDIGKGEKNDDGTPLTPDFKDPAQELIERYGHFHVDPNKYGALRIPSRPEGCDFIYSRDKATGRYGLVWRPGLSDEARRATIQDMLGEILRDPETLAKSSHLLRQLGMWAAEEADYAAINEVFALARESWPALPQDIQLAELAYRLTQYPDTAVCLIEQLGAIRVALWRSEVPMPGNVSAQDVALLLNPVTGQLIDLRARPREWFTRQPGFVPISGPW